MLPGSRCWEANHKLKLLVTPAGFKQENKNQHLVCPTGAKPLPENKTQFPELSNLLPVPRHRPAASFNAIKSIT
jgi:hypothetical protein